MYEDVFDIEKLAFFKHLRKSSEIWNAQEVSLDTCEFMKILDDKAMETGNLQGTTFITWLQFLLINHDFMWSKEETPKQNVNFSMGCRIISPFHNFWGVWGLDKSLKMKYGNHYSHKSARISIKNFSNYRHGRWRSLTRWCCGRYTKIYFGRYTKIE